MTARAKPAAVPQNFEFIDLLEREESFEEAIAEGLSGAQKAIPCRFLYDARGSELFDEICVLPEYYPTRTEIAILKENADAMARLIGPDAALVELGSGSSIKTHILLRRMNSPAAYVPVDVSREHLRASASDLAADYPGLRVIAICADYAAPFDLPDTSGRNVAFFPGSTIGNLSRDGALDLLKTWRRRLGDDGMMIVGVDLKKEPRILEAAYDDAAGVTETFIRNILERANRELGADFDLSGFDYDARWNADEGRVEMRLVSTGDQRADVAGKTYRFAKGESVHVENSHKYGLEEFSALARKAGFDSAARYVDADRLFSVHVLKSA